jgi:hypothetical protein
MPTVKEEKCPRCEMDASMLSMAAAHIACGTLKDDDERGKCNEWAAGIDPAKMTAEQMMEELYDRAGIDGLSRMPELYNQQIRSLVIKKVGTKLEHGERVTKEEQELYNKYTKKEMAKGI